MIKKYIKKQSLLILSSVLMALGIMMTTQVYEASTGNLKSASICQDSNGTSYGNHGDGHWHVAVKHAKGWAASGGNLGYDNPCYQSSNRSVDVNADAAPAIEPEPIVNKAPELKIKNVSVHKYHTELPDVINAEQLIKLFNVTAADEEDGDLSKHVQVSPDQIKIDSDDAEHQINFVVTDSGALQHEMIVTLKVSKNELPILHYNENLVFDRNPSCKQLLRDKVISVSDRENSNAELACQHIEVDKANNLIKVSYIDLHGAEISEEISYIVNKTNSLPLILVSSIIILTAVIYIIKKLKLL